MASNTSVFFKVSDMAWRDSLFGTTLWIPSCHPVKWCSSQKGPFAFLSTTFHKIQHHCKKSSLKKNQKNPVPTISAGPQPFLANVPHILSGYQGYHPSRCCHWASPTHFCSSRSALTTRPEFTPFRNSSLASELHKTVYKFNMGTYIHTYIHT